MFHMIENRVWKIDYSRCLGPRFGVKIFYACHTFLNVFIKLKKISDAIFMTKCVISGKLSKNILRLVMAEKGLLFERILQKCTA